MSRPRYDWWGYVKGMIRRYPELRMEYADLHTQRITPNYSGMPGSGGSGRAVEDVVLRELPTTRQREYDAVRQAVEATERMKNGRDRLKVIDLVFWKKTHTLDGAALAVNYSYDTVQNWHREFIRLVAKYRGFLDGEEKNT